MSLLSKLANPEKSSRFKWVKGSSSNRFNDLLIKNTIPMTRYDNFLTFCDTGKEFESKGYLLKISTNKNHNADLACLADNKIIV